MPTPTPSAEFTVNGSDVSGAVAVSVSSTVTLALKSTFGIDSVSWSIPGRHDVDAATPAITVGGSPYGATATFQVPSGAPQGYKVECLVNGGRDRAGQIQSSYKFTALIGVLDSAGRFPFVYGETTERGELGYTDALNDLVAGVAGTVTPYSTMAALRAVAPVNGAVRETLGYADIGDGGGGAWKGVTGASPGTYTHNGGTVIVPSGGNGSAAWIRDWNGPLDVRAFGVKADDTTNDTSALQAAAALGVSLQLPIGLMKISGDVTFTADVRGHGIMEFADFTHGTAFTHLAGGRIVVTGNPTVEGFTCFCNGLATNGIRLHNANGATLRNISVQNALRDGIIPSADGNNNNVQCTNVSTLSCGTTYSTGTITASAGDTVLTVVGAGDLTTLGVRTAQDYFTAQDDIDACLADFALSGSDDDLPYPYEITAVTSNTITIYPALRKALTSSAYGIHMGSGISLQLNPNNGGWTIEGGAHQNNKGAGIQEISLYGSQTVGVTFESNTVGRAVGRRSSDVAVQGWGFDRDYHEASTTVDVLVQYGVRGVGRDGSGGSQGDGRIKVGAYLSARLPVVLADAPTIVTKASPFNEGNPNNVLNRLVRVTSADDFTVAVVTVQDELSGVWAFPDGVTLQYQAPRGGLKFARNNANVSIDGLDTVFAEGPVFLTKVATNRWIAMGRESSGGLTSIGSGLSVIYALCADYEPTYSGTMRGEGASPPAVTFTGTLTRPFAIDIVSGGARGTATFRYSVNGGESWTNPVVTAATVDLTSALGVTLAFAAGTYSGDNLYYPRISALADQVGANDISQVTDASRPVVIAEWSGGHRAIRFDGGQNLSRTTFTGGAVSQPLTRFVVGSWPSSGVHTIVDGGSSRVVLYSDSGSATIFAGAGAAFGGGSAGSKFVAAFIANGSSTYAIIYFDDGRVLETLALISVGSNTQNGATWGSDNAGAGNLTGSLAFDMLVSGQMSRADIERKLSQLRRHYAIAV